MTPIEILIDELPRKGLANVVIHSGFVVTGVVTTLLGPILPILIARWSMSDERAGLFFTLQFCGNLVGIASLGPLISRRGYGMTLVIGFTSIALGIAALILGSELVAMISTALMGYGLGVILSGTNLWVAEVAASRRVAALSVVNLAWGIGAIACPALVMFAQSRHKLAPLLFGIASFSALVALALAAMDIEPRSQGSDNEGAQRRQPMVNRQTAFALGGLFFLYVGTEVSLGGWTGALANRMATTSGNLWALAPMFFWAGLLTGRALAPVVLLRVNERAVLTIGLILAAIGNGALLWVTTFQGAAICVTATGLGLACIYPVLVAWMVGHYGDRARGIGTVMFALASVGGATMPWLVGFTSTRAGSLRAGLLVPLAACLVMMSLLSLPRRPSLS
jgi:MFS transporter, FHS family, glucose/mannose:H+ symporter